MPVTKKLLIPQGDSLTEEDFKKIQQEYGLSEFCLKQMLQCNSKDYKGTILTVTITAQCKPAPCNENEFKDLAEKGVKKIILSEKDIKNL
jgi:hypothetical protein